MILILVVPLVLCALWDLRAFFDGIVLFQIRQPLRLDASSMAVFLEREFQVKLFSGVGYPLLLLVQTAISLSLCMKLRRRRLLSDLVMQTRAVVILCAMQFFTFVFFAKQAFGNYYYLLFTALFLFIVVSFQSGDERAFSNDSTVFP